MAGTMRALLCACPLGVVVGVGAGCTPADFVFVASDSTTTGVGAAGGSGGAGAGGGGGGGSGGEPTFQLIDPLKGTTVGNQIGGTLGPDGWTVTSDTDRIWYALPRLVQGSLTVSVSNLSLAGNMPLVDHELIAMYEAGYGIPEPINYDPEYRNNHYKVNLRIHGQAATGLEGQQQLVWRMCPSGAPGFDDCACPEFLGEPQGGEPTWDGSPHELRLEWGGGATRYYRDGALVHTITWNTTVYGPEELHVSLGSSRPVVIQEAGMPIGAVFSDLIIEGFEGDAASCR